MGVLWTSAILLLLLPLKVSFSGKAEPRVSIAIEPLSSGDGFSVLCHLPRSVTVSQVNWIVFRGPNRTHLATYHPTHGKYIPPEFQERVEVQSSSDEGHSYGAVLTGGAVGENDSVCCTFNTFPFGVFQKCIETKMLGAATSVEAVTEEAKQEMERTALEWVLLVLGFLTCSLSVAVTMAQCWKCGGYCCYRRKVFEVRYAINHSSIDTEDRTDAAIQQRPLPAIPCENPMEIKTQAKPKPKPLGFDPSKLYAKIRLDLLYGRLWKAYQGVPKPWSFSPPPPPPPHPPPPLPLRPTQETSQKMYALLGEHGPVLLMEEAPDSQLLSPAQSPGLAPGPVPLLEPKADCLLLSQPGPTASPPTTPQ